jgi:hypothetical protein
MLVLAFAARIVARRVRTPNGPFSQLPQLDLTRRHDGVSAYRRPGHNPRISEAALQTMIKDRWPGFSSK